MTSRVYKVRLSRWCLVKATTAPDLGNLDDANLAAYPATIRRLAHRFAPRHVIPGHGTIAGDAIAHTARMAQATIAT